MHFIRVQITSCKSILRSQQLNDNINPHSYLSNTCVYAHMWTVYSLWAWMRMSDECGFNKHPTSMRCDPISWKQSLFTASDRANLLLHQPRDWFRREGRRRRSGHLFFPPLSFPDCPVCSIRFRGWSNWSELLCATLTHTLSRSHVFLSALRLWACLSDCTAMQNWPFSFPGAGANGALQLHYWLSQWQRRGFLPYSGVLRPP